MKRAEGSKQDGYMFVRGKRASRKNCPVLPGKFAIGGGTENQHVLKGFVGRKSGYQREMGDMGPIG